MLSKISLYGALFPNLSIPIGKPLFFKYLCQQLTEPASIETIRFSFSITLFLYSSFVHRTTLGKE
jgi:hypothetical protein